MATTTNYGWVTPDDTALVKDGAAAIRTLGSSVDTTTKNLNPSTTLGDIEYRSSTANVNTRLPLGTAGQVLKVNSGATAPEWSSDNAGMTNPMTTTGDTIYSSSGSTPARLGIGTTGQILTVAGGVPSWAAAPAAGSSWSLLNAGGTTLSGTSTSVSGISGVDKIMVILEQASTSGASSSIDIRVNGSTSAIYNYVGLQLDAPGSYSPGGVFSDIRAFGNAQGIPVGKMSSSASSRVTAGLTMTGANSSGLKAFQSVGAANPFGSNDAIMYVLQGWFDTSSTISSVDIISQGSSFDAGKVYIYTSA